MKEKSENEDKRQVLVYKEHEQWGRYEKWWMMPISLLRELSVAAYQCEEDYFAEQIQMIREAHPNSVLVY